MSALCAAEQGVTFVQLKRSCELTDGNLSRHLKVLSEANAVRIKKEFIDSKPRTTVFLTDEGIESFNRYLNALQEFLQETLEAMPQNSRDESDNCMLINKITVT